MSQLEAKITKAITASGVKVFRNSPEVQAQPDMVGILNGQLVQMSITSSPRANYSEASYFNAAHFQHIADWLDHRRVERRMQQSVAARGRR